MNIYSQAFKILSKLKAAEMIAVIPKVDLNHTAL